MKSLFVVFLILFAFTSCDNSKNNPSDDDVSMNQFQVSETELKEAVLRRGDHRAYNQLRISYLDFPNEEEFMFYAFIMANKYDYPRAYLDVYFYLTSAFSKDINEIDDKSAKLAIEYLLLASEKGHQQAKEIVQEFSITKRENSKTQLLRIFKGK